MNENVIRKRVQEWKRTNKINKPGALILLEAYRRVLSFADGDFHYDMALLAYPSTVNKTLFKPTGGVESKRVLNWYALTDKGLKLLTALHESLTKSMQPTYIASVLSNSVHNNYDDLV